MGLLLAPSSLALRLEEDLATDPTKTHDYAAAERHEHGERYERADETVTHDVVRDQPPGPLLRRRNGRGDRPGIIVAVDRRAVGLGLDEVRDAADDGRDGDAGDRQLEPAHGPQVNVAG